MYGWIHKILRDAIVNLRGAEKWNEICMHAGVGEDKLSSCDNTTYIGDTEYFALITATLELLPDVSEQALYDIFADDFISYLQKNGYEPYLRTFGDTLFELLDNMNRLHAHLACSMEKMQIPSIHCEACEEKNSFFLHYSSPRGDRLTCLLVGLVKTVARTYFSREVTLTELARQGDAAGSPATIWKVWQGRERQFVTLHAFIVCFV
jgi:guanylate cyclase soluble subunit beta